jgi:putative DNA primase/helicase
MVQIPPVSAIFATGNNLQIHGDLTRRFLICQLDPGMERPEERKFSRDLLAEAGQRRGELISAALTVARYGLSLDPRDYDGGFPGFQDWYCRVALPLVALGMPDPVKSLDLARATDSDAEALEQLMMAWWAQYGDQEMICKDVVDTACITLDEALKTVAADQTGEPCTQRLGQYLSRVQNRIVAGKRFVRLPKRGEGVRWRLEHVSSPSQ